MKSEYERRAAASALRLSDLELFPFRCPNCAATFEGGEPGNIRLFCTIQCTDEAAWVRYVRRSISDGRLELDPGVDETCQIRLAHALNGGYDKQRRTLRTRPTKCLECGLRVRCQFAPFTRKILRWRWVDRFRHGSAHSVRFRGAVVYCTSMQSTHAGMFGSFGGLTNILGRYNSCVKRREIAYGWQETIRPPRLGRRCLSGLGTGRCWWTHANRGLGGDFPFLTRIFNRGLIAAASKARESGSMSQSTNRASYWSARWTHAQSDITTSRFRKSIR